MKEKIISAFEEAGFDLEMTKYGYTFQYEGLNYLLDAGNDKDDGFLALFIPAIIKKKGLNELSFYKFLSILNSRLRYVKVFELGDSMWLSYERKLMSDENIDILIQDMINTMDLAIHFLQDLQNTLVDKPCTGKSIEVLDNLVFNDLDSLDDPNLEKTE